MAMIRVSESLRNEFRSRGMHRRSEDYGYGLGIATYCVLALVGFPGLVLWIMYWVRILNLSARIALPVWDEDEEDEGAEDDYDSYYHDDDDARPRRRNADDARPRRRDEGRKPWERPRR